MLTCSSSINPPTHVFFRDLLFQIVPRFHLSLFLQGSVAFFFTQSRIQSDSNNANLFVAVDLLSSLVFCLVVIIISDNI